MAYARRPAPKYCLHAFADVPNLSSLLAPSFVSHRSPLRAIFCHHRACHWVGHLQQQEGYQQDWAPHVHPLLALPYRPHGSFGCQVWVQWPGWRLCPPWLPPSAPAPSVCRRSTATASTPPLARYNFIAANPAVPANYSWMDNQDGGVCIATYPHGTPSQATELPYSGMCPGGTGPGALVTQGVDTHSVHPPQAHVLATRGNRGRCGGLIVHTGGGRTLCCCVDPFFVPDERANTYRDCCGKAFRQWWDIVLIPHEDPAAPPPSKV